MTDAFISGARIAAICLIPACWMPAALAQIVPSAPIVRRAHPMNSPYQSAATSSHAGNYYLLQWGVDSMRVKSVPSDQLIRFSYRVVDAGKAKSLSLKEASPELFDEKSRVSLVIPTMDKIGQLRQSGPPLNGKTYWMVFSNKGNVVKRGHRVGVAIGDFKASGLAVE